MVLAVVIGVTGYLVAVVVVGRQTERIDSRDNITRSRELSVIFGIKKSMLGWIASPRFVQIRSVATRRRKDGQVVQPPAVHGPRAGKTKKPSQLARLFGDGGERCFAFGDVGG
jgi:hypothetical protein